MSHTKIEHLKFKTFNINIVTGSEKSKSTRLLILSSFTRLLLVYKVCPPPRHRRATRLESDKIIIRIRIVEMSHIETEHLQ